MMFLACLCLSLGVYDALPPDDATDVVVTDEASSTDTSLDTQDESMVVIVDNVDDIASALADALVPDDGIVAQAVSPPASAGRWFVMGSKTYLVPANYADYVVVLDEAPYILNVSSTTITLYTASDDGYTYRLAPYTQLERRQNTSGYTWTSAPVTAVTDTNLLPDSWGTDQLLWLVAGLLCLLLVVVYCQRSGH